MTKEADEALVDRLVKRLNTTLDERAQVAAVVSEAQFLVTRYAGPVTPAEILALATVEVGAELWARRDAKGGIIAAFVDGPVTRLARDPMVAAYPLLDPWVGVVFG